MSLHECYEPCRTRHGPCAATFAGGKAYDQVTYVYAREQGEYKDEEANQANHKK